MIVPKFEKDYSSATILKLFSLEKITSFLNCRLISQSTLGACSFQIINFNNIRIHAHSRNVEEIYFNHDFMKSFSISIRRELILAVSENFLSHQAVVRNRN